MDSIWYILYTAVEETFVHKAARPCSQGFGHRNNMDRMSMPHEGCINAGCV